MFTAQTTLRNCASSLATSNDWNIALDEAIESTASALDGPPDIALLFISPHHAAAAEKIIAAATKRLGPATIIGCTGESIAGTSQEIEEEPALSLWLARWPNVTLTPMHLRFQRTPEGGAVEGWPESLAAE